MIEYRDSKWEGELSNCLIREEDEEVHRVLTLISLLMDIEGLHVHKNWRLTDTYASIANTSYRKDWLRINNYQQQYVNLGVRPASQRMVYG